VCFFGILHAEHHIYQDKAMMGRWGLEGMRSFEQPSVAAKEGDRLLATAAPTQQIDAAGSTLA
jgi:biotin synthase